MFLTDLNVRELQDGKKQLTLPLVYSNNASAYHVPIGFVTDYASVPRTPLLYALFNGVANRSATLHDFLYSSRAIPRHVADSVFLEAMCSEGTTSWKAYAMYYAVRLFGKSVRFKAYGINNE